MTYPRPQSQFPAFPNAVASFQQFLAANAWPTHLLWLSRDQITNHKRRLWIHPLPPDHATRMAEQQYNHALQQNLGLSLNALCKLPKLTACFVGFPRDAQEAEYALLTGSLKYKLHERNLNPTILTSRLLFLARRRLNALRHFGNTLLPALPIALPPPSPPVPISPHIQ